MGSGQKFLVDRMGMGRGTDEMGIPGWPPGERRPNKPPLWGSGVLPFPGMLREAAYVLRLDSLL